MGRSTRSLRCNPYWVFSRYRFREERIRAHIVREHRTGRALADIISDPYLKRLGPPERTAHVLQDPLTIAAIKRDVLDAIASYSPRR